jgi:cytoskeletal protein CcmA (bactofilin family)
VKLRARTTEEVSGFLDKGTNVTGELQFSGMVRVDGNFHGSISTTDVLVVGEHALIHADIQVGEIEIHGQIFGNIQANRKVDIFASGRVRGDIHTPVLAITPGASIDGQIFMSMETAGDGAVEEHTLSKESDEAADKR